MKRMAAIFRFTVLVFFLFNSISFASSGLLQWTGLERLAGGAFFLGSSPTNLEAYYRSRLEQFWEYYYSLLSDDTDNSMIFSRTGNTCSMVLVGSDPPKRPNNNDKKYNGISGKIRFDDLLVLITWLREQVNTHQLVVESCVSDLFEQLHSLLLSGQTNTRLFFHYTRLFNQYLRQNSQLVQYIRREFSDGLSPLRRGLLGSWSLVFF